MHIYLYLYFVFEGMAERCQELMIDRVKTRVAFGRPLVEQGTIQQDIALNRYIHLVEQGTIQQDIALNRYIPLVEQGTIQQDIALNRYIPLVEQGTI